MLSSAILYANGSLALILNTIVFYLATKKSLTSIASEIRTFLVNRALTNICLTIVNTALQHEYNVFDNKLAVLANGPIQHCGEYPIFIFYLLSVNLTLYLLLTFAFLFVYRFMVVCKWQVFEHYLTPRNRVFAFLIVLLLCSIQMTLIVHSLCG